jgi:hypothetical protein
MTDGFLRITAGECNYYDADRLGNSVFYLKLICPYIFGQIWQLGGAVYGTRELERF